MKKFRAKINAPFVKKDKIYEVDDKGFYGMNLSHSYYEIMLNNYPDLFEPVEEKSDQEKWLEVLMGYYPYTKKGKDRDFKTLAANLVLLGYNPDQIYKEVFGEG